MGEAAATGPGLGWREGDVGRGKQLHPGVGPRNGSQGTQIQKVREGAGEGVIIWGTCGLTENQRVKQL